jgi:ribosomal-protein-alanine N-acetyltransferase
MQRRLTNSSRWNSAERPSTARLLKVQLGRSCQRTFAAMTQSRSAVTRRATGGYLFAYESVAVMAGAATPGHEVVLETGRLLLRPWRVAEAVVQRELWTERDPRVRPHRRIDADGHPTVADLEDAIRTNQPSSVGLLAVERKATRDVIGYCGLIDSGRGSEGEPELAFELQRRVWRQGYATEASLAVLDWARSSGYARLWATVWEWNTASRRVLAKVGFTETERMEVDAVYGTTLFTTRRLDTPDVWA